MQFESLLARRYIKTQKRHSLLTVCSIIAALAMMTVLMTCFTTLTSCMASRERDVRPYHIQMLEVPDAAVDKLKSYSHVKEAKVIADYEVTEEDGKKYPAHTVNVTLEKGIGDIGSYYNKMCKEIGFDDFFEIHGSTRGNFNRTLMNYDRIDEDADYNAVISYAVYALYLIILALILRLVIDTAFEVSSKERERQFGVLQSVGATPNQIRGIIVREGLLLSVIGVPVGIGLGLLLGYGLFRVILYSGIIDAFFTSEEKALSLLHYEIQPVPLIICAAVGFVWVFLSALGTGTRVIRMTPIQAISNRSNTIKKVKKHSVFGLLFGWEGKLASRNARRQPKRFIVTVLSLTLSIAMFGMFSVLVDNFSKALESSIVVFDYIGPMNYDFSFARMEYVGEPFGYREGYRLLEESPVLNDTDFYFRIGTKTVNDGGVSIFYVNEHAWNRIFSTDDLEAPMTYAEFEKAGGYVAVNGSENALSADKQSAQIRTRCLTAIPEEELAKYTEDELQEMVENDTITRTVGYKRTDSVGSFDLSDDETGNEDIFAKVYCNYTETDRTVKILSCLHSDNILTNNMALNLVAPVSKYENEDQAWFGDMGKTVMMSTRLVSDDDYQAAVQFFKTNSREFTNYEDHFSMMRQIRSVLGAIKIGGTFFIIMFAVIAIINMVNIVSTGILNRKSELASMQCVGMTDGQLYGMTIIECAQFVIIACVAAIVLCALATWGTHVFLQDVLTLEAEEVVRGNVGIFSPVPRILLATGAAFVAALAASVFPLRRMQRETLVDRIRTVE